MKIIIVGAGPAGMMAAIVASKQHDVVLIDRNDKVGLKLRATGNGRCNITNNKNNRELIANLHNGKFLYSALSRFDAKKIIAFFTEHGVPLKEEDRGRMFPDSERAQDIVDVFSEEIRGLTLKLKTTIVDLIVEDDKVIGVVSDDGQRLLADKVVLACGGVTYPALGSDGRAHDFLEKHGVDVTDLYPVEASLISHEPFIQSKELQGLTIKHVIVSVLSESNKEVYKIHHDVLFTHFGLSGPAILATSEHVYQLLENKKTVTLKLCFVDNQKREEFFDMLLASPDKQIGNLLKPYLPKRMIVFILKRLGVDEKQTVKQLGHKLLRLITDELFDFRVEISDVMDIKRAFVTGGGVDLKEVDPKTFEHKRLKNLFICGELLDVHGSIGGYNLTIAMTTGHAVGEALLNETVTTE